jgi:hypothetical protein
VSPRFRYGKTPFMIFLLILSFFGTTVVVRVDAQTTVSFDPPVLVDTSLLPGAFFTLNVTVANIVDLYSWEVEIRFDYTFFSLSLDRVDEGPFLKGGGTTTFYEAMPSVSRVYMNCTLDPPATAGVDGSGTLASVRFLILKRGYTDPYFRNTYPRLYDRNKSPITFTLATPRAGFRNTETMFIEPLTIEKNPGNNFAVNVTVANVTNVYGWGVVLEWKVGLMSFMNAVEGPFLKTGGSTSFPTPSVGASSVMVGCTLLGFPPAVTPVNGSGVLATVNLQVVDTGNCSLNLVSGTKLECFNFTKGGIDTVFPTSQGSYFHTTRPVADFSWAPKDPALGETVTFNATNSYDPDQSYKGQTGNGIVSYHWDFGDDTQITESDPFASHTYSEYTVYAVKLNVTDDDGEWWESAKSLTIVTRDVAVIRIISSHDVAMPGTIVQVNATVANIGDVAEEFNVTAYYDTNLIGKQSVSLGSLKEKIVTFEWNTTGVPLGSYTLKAIADIVSPYEANITNNEFIDGSVTISTLNRIVRQVVIGGVTFYYVVESNSTVDNVAFKQATKEISFSATISEGTAGFFNVTIPMMLLNASSPDAWVVKFDGSSISIPTPTSNGTHYFVYATFDYNISNVQIIGTSVATAPIASFTSELQAYTHQVVTFDATASDDPDGTIVDYYWDFGDGTNATETDPVTTHVYAVGGQTYTVTLNVTDNQGLRTGASRNLLISWFTNVTVLSIIPSPSTLKSGEEVQISVTVRNDARSDKSQTFDVTVYYGNQTVQGNLLGVQTVSNLAPGSSSTLEFVWNTTGIPADITYTLKALATVLGESAPQDNTLVGGQVTIEKLITSVSVSASSTQVTIGDNVWIDGVVTPHAVGAKIMFQFRTVGETEWRKLAMATTFGEGEFLYIWKPSAVNSYEVYAIRFADDIYEESESSIISISVSKIVSSLSMDLSQDSIPIGNAVTISGSISPVRENISVTVQYRIGEGTWNTIQAVSTNAQGTYAFLWTPQDPGTYELKASWLGDETTLDAESSVETLSVKAPISSDLWGYILLAGLVIVGVAIAVYMFKFRKRK